MADSSLSEDASVCRECQICLEESAEVVAGALECGHDFCRSCLGKYVQVEFLEKGKSHLDLICPVAGCGTRFEEETIAEFGGAEVAAELAAVKETIPANPLAESLSLPRDFCYDFNDEGQLRHTKTGRKFHWVNQAHYDLLGDQIVPHIQQELMVKARGLQEMFLPTNDWLAANKVPESLPSHVRSNIFMTPDALTNPDKLMLLIQGSGAVRAGQWARALCINDSLRTGAILEYLDRATAAGYGVIVFNPNLTEQPADPLQGRPTAKDLCTPGRPKSKANAKFVKIPGNSRPDEHTIHVWDNVAKNAVAKDIVIVAHSAGGWCTLSLLKERGDEVLPRLRAIGFTDAVSRVLKRDPDHVKKAIVSLARNWVQSDRPLDTKEPQSLGYDEAKGCECVSAGHPKHEYTSAFAIDSVFAFLEEKLQASSSASHSADAS